MYIKQKIKNILISFLRKKVMKLFISYPFSLVTLYITFLLILDL
jgi:hypothetical protein